MKKLSKSYPYTVSHSRTLTDLSVDGYALTPSFDPEVQEYTVTVPSTVTSLDLTTTLAAGATKGTIVGNENFQGENSTVNRILVLLGLYVLSGSY